MFDRLAGRRWTSAERGWFLRRLGTYLTEEGRARLRTLREAEFGRLLRGLEARLGSEPELVLAALWKEEGPLPEEALLLERRALEALDPRRAGGLARERLESGHLLLAEIEDLEPGERVDRCERERSRVLALLRRMGRLDDLEPRREGRRLRRALGRLARRLRIQADESRLAARLERVFGARPVRWFGKLTFFALLGLLGLLVLDLFLPEESPFRGPILWADTAICGLFLWEFAVRLSLSPHRLSWFLRHFLTDFVPALPFALFLGPSGAGRELPSTEAGWEFLLRAVRLLRFPLYARYVRLLRPVVGLLRMTMFAIRGMDRIVADLAPLLNIEIVFFEPGSESGEGERKPPGALRKESPVAVFERLPASLRREAAPFLLDLLEKQCGAPPEEPEGKVPSPQARRRIRAEELCDRLRDLEEGTVRRFLRPDLLQGLGRMLGLLDLPLVRRIPGLRGFARAGRAPTPEERVVGAGRRAGEILAQVLSFLNGFADLAGVVTAPQILDRISTALLKSTQRPAFRLLLFGTLFLLVKLLFEVLLPFEGLGVGRFLDRFIATPLLIVGTICLALLLLARWMKKLAGEAGDRLLRSSEARFLNLGELVRRRYEKEDLEDLARRVTAGFEGGAEALAARVAEALTRLRGGRAVSVPPDPEASRFALLLLDAQDAAALHATDTKGSEQFLGSLDLVALRRRHLGLGRKDIRRLQALDPAGGFLLSGPRFWFDLCTQAVAIKVDRLCSLYDLHALDLERRSRASSEALERHERLLEGGEGLPVEPGGGLEAPRAFFHALHVLDPDPSWLLEIEEVYGPKVRRAFERDRRALIREIFGTRPLHRLPVERRTVNPLGAYRGRFEGGRILLLPLRIAAVWFRLAGRIFLLAGASAKAILRPKVEARGRELHAPFEVARRKLRRMKRPILLEGLQLLAWADPLYLGVWSRREGGRTVFEDLEDLDPTPRERRDFEARREAASRRLAWMGRAKFLEGKDLGGEEEFRLAAAFAADEGGLATLCAAEERLRAWLLAPEGEVPDGALPETRVARGAARRGFRKALTHLGEIGRAERRKLGKALGRRCGDFPQVCAAFEAAGPRRPVEAASRLAAGLLAETQTWRRRLETARAVTALLLQDLRHQEELVFELGGFAEDRMGSWS